MMKFYTYLIFAFLCIFHIKAQKPAPVSENCLKNTLVYDKEIPSLYNQDQLNKLNQQLDSWINDCGEYEVHQRIKLICALEKDSLTDSVINNKLIKNMLVYRAKKEGYFSNDTVFYLPFANTIDLVKTPGIDSLTLQATRDNSKSVKEPQKYLLQQFYSNQNDSVFYDIQKPNMAGTALQEAYYNYCNQLIRDSLILNIGLVSGLWIPTGKSNILGNHPVAGFQFGFKNRKNWNANISVIARVLSTQNQINLNFEDTLRSTREFMGGYFGIDLGKDIKRDVKNELRLIVGFGLDGLNFTTPVDSVVYSENISDWNFNTGIVYRRNLKQQLYWEMQVRYNFVNYETKAGEPTLQGITDLSGNSLSFRLSIGFLSGGYIRNAKLGHLQYVY